MMSDVGQSDDYDWVDDPDLTYDQTMEQFNQLVPDDGAGATPVVFVGNQYLTLADTGVQPAGNVAANARG